MQVPLWPVGPRDKAVEYVWQVSFGDADAVVGDAQQGQGAVATQVERYGAAPDRTDGVVDKIDYGPHQQDLVGPDEDGLVQAALQGDATIGGGFLRGFGPFR